MAVLEKGEIRRNTHILSGILSIGEGGGGSPRIVLVNVDDYNYSRFTPNVVYVLCEDKTDIETLVEVYCNGHLIATTKMNLDLLMGVLPSVIL